MVAFTPSSVKASLLVILISATYSSLTSVSALLLTSPLLAVNVYVPVDSFPVASNVTVLPSTVYFPSITVVPFLTSNVVSAGTAESNVAVNCVTFVAFNSVILPRAPGAVVGASVGASVGVSVGVSLGAVLGESVGFVSSFVTVTVTVAFLAMGRSLVENMGIIYCRGLGAV